MVRNSGPFRSPCLGTGWKPTCVHPMLGQLLDHLGDCPVCKGQGWTDEPPRAPDAGIIKFDEWMRKR
jgi:hypothetical protein